MRKSSNGLGCTSIEARGCYRDGPEGCDLANDGVLFVFQAPAAETKPVTSSSVFSMFGGGAKKEKKDDDEDRGDNSGSAKAQREAAAAAAAASKEGAEEVGYPKS